MKRKIDFVTNSSSTSFCGWGIRLSNSFDELPEKFQKAIYSEVLKWQEKNNSKCKFLTFEEFKSDVDNDWDWTDYLDDILNPHNMSYRTWYDEEIIFIGVSPISVDREKTINQIIEETQNFFDNFGFDENVFFIREFWYD